jgi:DNA-binding FadR family transcriptional regulator
MLGAFRDMLLQKKLAPGDLVPSEAVLSQSFGISRGSVREAMKILSAFGVVDIKRGNGTYISESIGDTLLDPFLLGLLASDHDIRQMAGLREIIERQVVALAVKNASPDDISRINGLLESMRQHAANTRGDIKTGVSLDLDFHQALGDATGNGLVSKLYRFIMRYFESTIEKTYSDSSGDFVPYDIHSAIARAIEARDGAAADRAVMESIEVWEKRYLNSR